MRKYVNWTCELAHKSTIPIDILYHIIEQEAHMSKRKAAKSRFSCSWALNNYILFLLQSTLNIQLTILSDVLPYLHTQWSVLSHPLSLPQSVHIHHIFLDQYTQQTL